MIADQTASTSLPDMTRVLADAEHGLVSLQPTLPLRFRFRWRDVVFQARVAASGPGEVRLSLYGDLGPMPYSAEAAETRRRLLSLARFADSDGFRFGVSRRHRLTLIGEARMIPPVTGASVISASTSLLLQLQPYLDLAVEEQTAVARPH